MDILKCLQNGQQRFQSYPDSVKSFSFRMNFHSPAAYSALREIFNNHLPHPRSVIRWYYGIDGSPGLNTQAFDILKKKVVDLNTEGKQLYVALISDEMAIKQHLQWDHINRKFVGLATYASQAKLNEYAQQNTFPLAKQTLVFMVVGENFKLAVAYFLLNGLSSEDRSDLTRAVIKKIHQTGAKVLTLTSDGYAGNIACAKILGADFKAGKPYFYDPDDPDRKIYIIWDPAHMIKLARGCLADKQLYHNGKPLKWDYILHLFRFQEDSIIPFGNKLKKEHINWKSRPMNVRLAVQTLSNSVANALEQLHKDGIAEMEGYEAVAEYIRINNNIFDISNSKEKNSNSTGFKRPICPATKDEYFEYFNYVKQYIKDLELKDGNENVSVFKSVLTTKSHTPFFGLLNNILSFEGLYHDYVESGNLDALFTFLFSQDHLETWFSCVRRLFRDNDNPTAMSFQGAFRKLLVCNSIVCSSFANVLNDDVKTLTLSLETAKKAQKQSKLDLRTIRSYEIDFDYCYEMNKDLTAYNRHIYAQLASLIEIDIIHAIKQCSKSSCQECINVLMECDPIGDSLLESNSELLPCKSTFDIVIACRRITELLSGAERSFESIFKTIYENLDMTKLFINSQFEEHAWNETHEMNHKDGFIYRVIETFLKIHSDFGGRRITEACTGEYIRHRLRKLYQLAGQ